VSQGVGRLHHHHETVLEHFWLRGRVYPDQTGSFLFSNGTWSRVRGRAD